MTKTNNCENEQKAGDISCNHFCAWVFENVEEVKCRLWIA